MNRIAVLLDKSGSMEPITTDTIGGFNSWLKELQDATGDAAALTLTMFDTQSRVLYENAPLSTVKQLTEASYQPSGNTALNDALGETLVSMKKQAKKGDRVLFLIITDGQENSSRHFTKAALREDIGALAKKGWEFQYIGANVDSFAESQAYGMTGSTQYSSTSAGTAANFVALTHSTQAWTANAGGNVKMADVQPTEVLDPEKEKESVTTP